MPARADNPTGFWEDREIVGLNERLLAALGHTWHSVSPIALPDWETPWLQDLFAEAVQLMRTATARWGAWGFKDPRTARLLPFWQPVLREVGADEGYVISVRHPLSVARSLERRNGFAEAKSHLLWLGHVLPALALSRGRPRVVVDYDSLMDDPAGQVERMAQGLRLRVLDPKALDAYANDFLSRDLRHTRFSSDDVRSPLSLTLVAKAYALSLRTSRDECAEADPDGRLALTALQHEFDGIAPLLELIDGRVEELDQLRIERVGWREEAERVSWHYQAEIGRIVSERAQLLAAKDEVWRAEVERVSGHYQAEIGRIASERDQLLAAKDEAWRQEVERVSGHYQVEIGRIASERDELLEAKDQAWRQEVERVSGHYQVEIGRIATEHGQELRAIAKERDVLARVAPLVSVIVVNLDGERYLRKLLPSLLAQTYPRLEVIVVDNASTDGSIPFLASLGAGVRVVRAHKNLGFAGGNNLGLSSSQGQYIALINNDAVVDRDWLRELVMEIESDPRIAAVGSKITFLQPYLRLTLRVPVFCPAKCGPSADTRELGLYLDESSQIEGCTYRKPLFMAGFGGREKTAGGFARWTGGQAELLLPFEPGGGNRTLLLLVTSGSPNAGRAFTVELGGRTLGEGVLGEGFAEYRFALPEAEVAALGRYVINNAASFLDNSGVTGDRGIFAPDEGQYDQAEDVTALCGGSMLLRRQAFEGVGGFDPVFFMYFEDVDLSWRLRRRGFRLRYQPASVVRHAHAGTSTEGSPLFVFFTARNRLLMLLKNAPWASVRSACWGELRYTANLFLAWVRAPRSGKAAAFDALWLRTRALASALVHSPGALAQRYRA